MEAFTRNRGGSSRGRETDPRNLPDWPRWDRRRPEVAPCVTPSTVDTYGRRVRGCGGVLGGNESPMLGKEPIWNKNYCSPKQYSRQGATSLVYIYLTLLVLLLIAISDCFHFNTQLPPRSSFSDRFNLTPLTNRRLENH